MFEVFNSKFINSTVRQDEGIKGAILVDSIIIRESDLQYRNGIQSIPKESIYDKNFLNNLKGLLIFNEHPRDMVKADNYERLASESVGTIVNTELRNMNGDNVVYGTLRITNPATVRNVIDKRIKGGSLGYYADNALINNKDTQINLRPNHFCLTNIPRDEKVEILNSKKETFMTEVEIMAIASKVKEQMLAETNITKNQPVTNTEDNFIVSKEKFNSFMQTIESRVKDEEIKKAMSLKNGIDKMSFIDNILSVKDVFTNSKEEEIAKEEGKAEAQAKDIKKDEESLGGYKAEIEKLKKENSLLQEQLEKKNSEENDKKKEDEKKENECGGKDEKKENECGDEKKNSQSVPLKTNTAVTNSNDNNVANILSQISF